MRFAVVLALFVAGCTSRTEELPSSDGSTADAARPLDATTSPDAGATDASVEDAAPADARAADAGALDAQPGRDAAGEVGAACAAPPDCLPGLTCLTEAPGGYCLPGAPGGPQACREPEAPCPAGTTCSPLPYHAISGVCLKPCMTNDDCRPNYRCDVVELFPGEPSSPRSPGPVCWTACQVGSDPSCNDNPAVSAVYGRCDQGVCICNRGATINPDTGRCR